MSYIVQLAITATAELLVIILSLLHSGMTAEEARVN